MIIMPHNKGSMYDDGLKFSVRMINKATSVEDDDYLMLIVGDTGSGKSNLGLHFMQEFMEEKANIKYIGLNKEQFANALKYAKTSTHPRMVINDEANVNRRESMSKYNKDMIDLYYSIRGLNIFHIWCNPSLEMIDKVFVKERIKAVIFVKKRSGNGRFYWFFKQADILRIFEKYDTLDLSILSKVSDRYAYYRGWFYEYQGDLKKPYLEIKDQRMEEKVDNFHEKYGSYETMQDISKIALKAGISLQTAKRYDRILLHEHKYEEGERDLSPGGKILLKETVILKFYQLSIMPKTKERKNFIAEV